MLAAEQRSVPRRYAAPAVAMAAAAAVAVAPVATSMGAVTAPSLPPIVADLGGAASAVANWATASGLKFVTDPITGLTKLVTDQVGNATVIGNVLLTSGQDVLKGIATGLPEALAEAQKLIAAGKPDDAWQEVANSVLAPVLGAVINGMTPIMNQLGPQIGPFADAFQAALTPILGLALPALTSILTPPALVLDGIQAAGKALLAGDPFGALNAIIDTAGKVGEFAQAAVFGEFGVAKGLVGLAPAILSGLAGSSWAGLGPFSTSTGNAATFTAASASTLAASPTAIPSLPGAADLTKLGEIWKNTFQMTGDALFGPLGLPDMLKSWATSLPQGDLALAYTKLHGVIGAGALVLGAGVLQSGDVLNKYLGPIGAGLDNASSSLLSLTLGVYNVTKDVPVAALTALQDFGKALLSGDPAKVAQVLSTGIATTLTTLVNGIFAEGQPFSPGVVPGLITVVKDFVDGATGKAAPQADLTSARSAAPAAESDGAASLDASSQVRASKLMTHPAQPQSPLPSESDDSTPAPVADVPVREVPAKEVPVKEVPATPQTKELPSTDAPSASEPGTDAPEQDAPAKDAPAKDTPVKEQPTGEATKDAPSKDAPSKDAPAKDAPSGAAAA